MALQRTPYRLILNNESETKVKDFPEIMEELSPVTTVVYLTRDEYNYQMSRANALWCHPQTREECWFDDNWYEEDHSDLIKD